MEIGNFEAKVYVKLKDGSIKWPEGLNTRIKVEPILTFAGNTIYTAFVRLFGDAKFNGAIQSDDEDEAYDPDSVRKKNSVKINVKKSKW